MDLRGATGVQVGDNPQMHLHLRAERPPWWTRSGYIEQVRDIAPGGGLPGGLKERDAELAELSVFCAGDDPYLWWKAEPWAGKSALLATFVLNPPAGVEVVAFFITARLSAQSDSTAFTDALIDQLGALARESVPVSLTPAARDAHRRALLRAAVERVRGEGRRLVLVVDGLDEDCGGQTGSGLASVASLLPKVCGDSLRIVVASRPDRPLPGDVPGDHPLRSGCRVRELAPSPYAAEIAELATRELGELLHGDETAPRDVLGLVTACGGGLTLAELEELTGLAPYQLERLVSGVFGRTVAGRADHGPGAHRLHLFSHDTLRKSAIQSFGAGLAGYRDRIHAWADRYIEQAWPEATPQYLLRGYAAMLRDTGDVQRLTALATDRSRKQRMLSLGEGDTTSLTEIRMAQDLLLTRPNPDLLALARLSIRREDLESRNTNVPPCLPAVWAAIGQPARAESLAYTIASGCRAQALTALVRVLVATDPDHARRIAAEAASTAQIIPDTGERVVVLAALARAIFPADPDFARRVLTDAAASALGIINSTRREQAAAEVDQAIADIDRAQRGGETTETAEDESRLPAWLNTGRRSYRNDALDLAHDRARMAWSALAADPADTMRLAEECEALARTVSHPDRRPRALTEIARAVATTGDHERAEAIINMIEHPHRIQARDDFVRPAPAGERARDERIAATEAMSQRPDDLAEAARTIAAGGDHRRAETAVGRIDHLGWRAWALADIARESAAAGDHARAARLAAEAVSCASYLNDLDWYARAMAHIVRRVAEHDPDAAEKIARRINHPDRRAESLAVVARAAAGKDPDLTIRIAKEIQAEARVNTDPGRLPRAVATVAPAVAEAGDPGHAEAMSRAINDPDWRATALAETAGFVARSDPDRAERIAHTIDQSAQRAQALTMIALLVADRGDPEHAEEIVRGIADSGRRAVALTRLAEIADPVAAARLIGEAFAIGSWWAPLPLVARLRPELIPHIAAEVLAGG